MPFIIAPPKLQEVFTLSVPQHMLEKLYWELGIFKACVKGSGRPAHCFSRFRFCLDELRRNSDTLR
jgi:hypothetical protein